MREKELKKFNNMPDWLDKLSYAIKMYTLIELEKYAENNFILK